MAVEQLSAAQLKARLDSGEAIVLLDVREPWEQEICAIPASRLMPMATIPGALDTLDRDATIVTVCHHGIRSQHAGEFLAANGFTSVANLSGGVDAWACEVDPGMPRY